MKNDESEHDQSADNHVARSPARFDVTAIAVGFGSGATIFDRQKDCEVNVQENADQKKRADEPEQWAEITQMLRVGVDPLRPKIDLEIAKQVTKHEQDQNHAGNGDD